MAKCSPPRNHNTTNIGSLLQHHHPPLSAANHHRLWSSSSLRRLILDALSCGSHSRHRPTTTTTEQQPPPPPPPPPQAKKSTDKKIIKKKKSEKLLDLLNIAEAEMETETKRKEEALEEMKGVVVVNLQDMSNRNVRREAALKVRSLAKEDSNARLTLAMLGAIPPLVAMLDSDRHQSDPVDHHPHPQEEEDQVQCFLASLYALLNLGIGNDLNKAAIVKAGAVHKMLKIIESRKLTNPSISEAIVANFLGLSALDSNKPVISSSGAIPFLVDALKDFHQRSCLQAKQDALKALFNLSILPLNVPFILETDLIPFIMNLLGDMEVSERILSILSNVVSTPEGRKAISSVRDAFPILVDVLNWNDSPECQEKASYILMVMAHKSYGDRQTMLEAGIASALLELTLLGSTLAQKRASRILEFLRVDKGKQVSGNGAAVSAPICGGSTSSTNPNGVLKGSLVETEDLMSEEKKAVKQLVQQSLQNNMRRIVNRANLPQDFVPSEHFKSLTASSTSKSLPF